MLAVALALAASLSWGTADFLGGQQAKRLPALAVVLWSKLAALPVLAVLALVASDLPRGEQLAVAAAGGVAGIAAVAALYAALSLGPMTLVAPVTGAAAAIPASIALATGTPPSAVVLAGMAAALLGVVAVARVPAPPGQAAFGRASLGMALLAMTLLGTWAALVQRASQLAGGRAIGIAAVGTLTGLLALGLVLAARRRRVPAPAAPARPALVAVGLLDAGGLTLFAAASEGASVAAVAVLGALYPVATVLLARVFLRERIGAAQGAGVVVVFLGVALIAAGG